MAFIYQRFNSIIFKIGTIIILAEMAVLTVVGFTYITRFSEQVDRRVAAQVQIPGTLMRASLLSYNSVQHKETIKQLVGEEIIKALVVGVSKNVFFSPDSDDRGQNIANILDVDASLFDIHNPRDRVVFEGANVTSISSIFGPDGKTLRMFLYLKAGTGEAEAEKAAMVHLFLFGSALTVVVTSLIILFSFKFMILNKITRVLHALERVEAGDLNAQVEGTISTDEIGHLAKSFAYMRDEIRTKIHALQQLNEELDQRVAQRTAQLESTNKELKSFAYVASHDLKAPLRAVSRLAHWLVEDNADAFDEKGKEMAGLLIGRVTRMDKLIDGILHYSRVGRIIGEREHIDLNLLVGDVIDTIAAPEHIHIIVENELPIIIGDRIRLVQIFQNLIGNAVKFMDKPEGRIALGSENEDSFWKFHVVDNGPGIDERYHERIFQIFQTLTPRDEQENSGVGLAIVKKIVELYGGKVWVESEVGKGSTFLFTLSKTPPNSSDVSLKNET